MVLEASKKFEMPLTEGAPVKSHVKDLSLAERVAGASSGPRPRCRCCARSASGSSKEQPLKACASLPAST